MRCFFNFKPKKSSSDIQQLIQFEEKIKRELKQQILQDLEAKPMATNKVAVEGIVETRVEKKKEKDNFWTLLSKWNRLLAALSSISIVIAAMSVYTYLADIGSRHLLGDIISQPSVFLSIVILFAVFILFITLPMYVPFVLAEYITSEFLKGSNESKENITKAKECNYIALMTSFFIFQLITIICIYIYLHSNISESIKDTTGWDLDFFIIWLIGLVIFSTLSVCIKKRYIKNLTWNFKLCFSHVVTHFFTNFIYLFVIFLALAISSNWFDDDSTFVYWLILFFVLNMICAFASYCFILPEKTPENKEIRKLIWLIPLIVVVLFSLWGFGLNGAKFKQYLFQNLGYIEMPSQARWYLLDKRYLEWNNINKNKIEALGPLKTNYPPLWRNEFKFLPEFSQNYQNHFYNYYPDNAFFGYMAWNLGKIKIFCPKVVEPDKNVIDKCLYIKDDYLQPMPQRI